LRYKREKILYLILLFSGTYSSAMDWQTINQEIMHVLQQGYSLEDVALATFKPCTTDRTKLFWIWVAKIGYHAVPVIAAFGPALYTLVQGYATEATIISCVYPFARLIWYGNRNATMVSNEVAAKRLLPKQYAQHYKKCEQLYCACHK